MSNCDITVRIFVHCIDLLLEHAATQCPACSSETCSVQSCKRLALQMLKPIWRSVGRHRRKNPLYGFSGRQTSARRSCRVVWLRASDGGQARVVKIQWLGSAAAELPVSPSPSLYHKNSICFFLFRPEGQVPQRSRDTARGWRASPAACGNILERISAKVSVRLH